MTETGMLDGMSKEKYDEIVSAIPLRRAAKPREVAGACLFLASELSGYIRSPTSVFSPASRPRSSRL